MATKVKLPKVIFCTALWVLPLKSMAPPKEPPSPAGVEIKPAPETPIAAYKEQLGRQSWDPEWDLIIEKALPVALLSPQVSKAVRPFCPRFVALSQADKRAFWAYFFQALAGAEAGLEPTTDVHHESVDEKDRVTGRTVRAQGLLQLTYMDSVRHGCDFDWERDKHLPVHDPSKTILQPRNNLVCGVKILEDQLVNRQHRLLSSTSYWATLRPGTLSYKVFAKQMTNVPLVCRKAPSATDLRTERSPETDPVAAEQAASGSD